MKFVLLLKQIVFLVYIYVWMGLMRVWATCNMNVGDKVALANIVALGLVVARRAPIFPVVSC